MFVTWVLAVTEHEAACFFQADACAAEEAGLAGGVPHHAGDVEAAANGIEGFVASAVQGITQRIDGIGKCSGRGVGAVAEGEVVGQGRHG